MKLFTRRLKRLMKDNDFDTESLSDEIGVEEYSVKKWVNGLHYPSVENLILLAQTFECSTDYLLGLSDTFNPDNDEDDDEDEDNDYDEEEDEEEEEEQDEDDDNDNYTEIYPRRFSLFKKLFNFVRYFPFKKLFICVGIVFLFFLLLRACSSV